LKKSAWHRFYFSGFSGFAVKNSGVFDRAELPARNANCRACRNEVYIYNRDIMNRLNSGRGFSPAPSAKNALPALLLAAALAFAGCAGLPPGTAAPEAVPQAPPPGPPSGESGYTAGPPPGFPPEAGEYLEALARAFSTADRAFLLAQGESQFEADNRGRYDEETYLALLYRAGPLSGDGLSAPPGSPRLDPGQIRRIEFANWEEQGPALIVEARLITRSGGEVPCRLALLWRLREPKILGAYP
jgi:hypothetical protein